MHWPLADLLSKSSLKKIILSSKNKSLGIASIKQNALNIGIFNSFCTLPNYLWAVK